MNSLMKIVVGEHGFNFSEKMPVVIKCVVPCEYIKDLLSELKNMVEEGVVFTTPIDLIMNK